MGYLTEHIPTAQQRYTKHFGLDMTFVTVLNSPQEVGGEAMKRGRRGRKRKEVNGSGRRKKRRWEEKGALSSGRG